MGSDSGGQLSNRSLSTHRNMEMEKELLESAMRLHGRSECVERVISMESESAIPKGENYLSTIYRITLKVVLGNGRQAKKSLILKVIPTGAAKVEFVKELGVFRVEIKMYTVVLREMEMLMEEFNDTNDVLWCRILHYEPYRLLLLEDLKVSGFRMTRRQDHLDLNHALLVVRSLARFHAISKVMEHRGIISRDDYKPYAIVNDRKSVEYIMHAMLMLLAKAMEKLWGPEWHDVAQKLKVPRDWLVKNTFKMTDIDESRFNCLNHGDCWSNNMMFKYDWRNQPITMRFVDWQVVHYNSPAYDIVYNIYSSVLPKVRRENYDRLLSTYVDAMNSTLTVYGLQDSEFRKLTIEELKAEIDRIIFLKIWGLGVINAIVTNDRDDVFDMDLALKSRGTKGLNINMFNLKYRDKTGSDWKIIADQLYELYAKESDG